MNYEDVSRLVEYHYWARDRVLEALVPLTTLEYTRNLGSSFKSIRDTAVHTFAAEFAWYSRWKGMSPAHLLPGERFPNVFALQSAWWDLEMAVRLFLHGLGPLGVNRNFEYRTLAGQPRKSAFWEMVQHVVNHASYHRGQLTTMLRQIGAAPPRSTDQISFFRLKNDLVMAKPKSA